MGLAQVAHRGFKFPSNNFYKTNSFREARNFDELSKELLKKINLSEYFISFTRFPATHTELPDRIKCTAKQVSEKAFGLILKYSQAFLFSYQGITSEGIWNGSSQWEAPSCGCANKRAYPPPHPPHPKKKTPTKRKEL